jgi:hypothetical protein
MTECDELCVSVDLLPLSLRRETAMGEQSQGHPNCDINWSHKERGNVPSTRI